MALTALARHARAAETTAALDFRNQLTTAKLLLEIEIGDATFRLHRLRDFLGRNF